MPTYTFAGRYSEVFIDRFGNALASMPVTVYLEDGTTLATVYTTRTKAAGANPTATDARGNLTFFADPDTYKLVATWNGTVQPAVEVSVNIDPSDTSAASIIPVQDEGVTTVAVPTAVNFTGAGVEVTNVGNVATVTIGGSTNATPATTVTSETAFGVAAVVGTGVPYARDDHTHGSPTNPVTAHEADVTDVHTAAGITNVAAGGDRGDHGAGCPERVGRGEVGPRPHPHVRRCHA